jgi:S1-C subfamily serine protease
MRSTSITKTLLTIASIAFLLACAPFPSFAESKSLSDLFQAQKKAVFLITQGIYLDSSKIQHRDLFEKIEAGTGKKLLDEYIPISSGTCFLVNSDGYVITAAHVIKPMVANDKNDAAQWSYLQFLTTNLAPGYLTKSQLKQATTEYQAFVKKTPAVISLKSISGREYVATVISQDTALDLALLKFNPDETLEPIPIDETATLKEGDAVYSIGYPLQMLMDKFLDDFKPTLTNGIVSAIRTDDWDIQHTASISPGNSGGPLFLQNGTLVGVNVGLMTNANSVYFSINSRKIVHWLSSIDKGDILAKTAKP